MLRRLARAGFNRDFARSAILPEWWEPAYAGDPTLLPDIEIRVARFMGVPVSELRKPDVQLQPTRYPGAQLRRVTNVDRDRLAPAIHASMRIATAVVRNLRPSASAMDLPPADGLAWRKLLAPAKGVIRLRHLLNDVWRRGIPVVPVEVLPSPSFQAMACVVNDRPVVLLAHRHDEPGRVAVFIAHELGHVTAGDCEAGIPVVDEREDVPDEADIERRAEQFATRLLVGTDTVPHVDVTDPRQLARQAALIERERQIDAGAVIFAWARGSGDYATATTAVKALYRATGARRLLREAFDEWVDVAGASESDRALLRCLYAGPAADATPH